MKERLVARVRLCTPDEVKYVVQVAGFAIDLQVSGVEITLLARKPA